MLKLVEFLFVCKGFFVLFFGKGGGGVVTTWTELLCFHFIFIVGGGM